MEIIEVDFHLERETGWEDKWEVRFRNGQVGEVIHISHIAENVVLCLVMLGNIARDADALQVLMVLDDRVMRVDVT